MPRSRWKAAERAIALTLAICCWRHAEAADWFGPPCTVSATQPDLVPVGETLLLLQAMTRPDDAGTSIPVLRGADGALWIGADALQTLQLPTPAGGRLDQGRRWYPLSAIRGLHYRYDACTQLLWLDTLGLPKQRRIFAVEGVSPLPSLDVTPGGYLNLDTQYQSIAGQGSLAMLPELALFNQYGYGGTTVLINKQGSHRLDTNWNVDDSDRLLRLTLGDSISRASEFGQSVRFGGIQWGRAFSLRPDIITFPQPSVRSSAALPSTVDIYVNQSLRGRQDVPAGPFELTQLPVQVGQGQVQLVARDVLGRQTIVNYPIYASQSLLRRGLDDFTLEAGWQRQDYTVRSAVYGPFLAAGTWRRGITDALTMELRAEQSAAHPGLSATAIQLLPQVGVLSAGVGASYGGDGFGGGYLLGLQRIADLWSFSLETRRSQAHYQRIGDDGNSLLARDLASVGVNLGDAGSLSFTGLRQRRQRDGASDILGLTYSLRVLNDLFASANATRSHSAGSVDHQALLLLSYNFGNNLFGNAQLLRDQNAGYQEQFTVQKAINDLLGVGYQATAGFGQNAHQGAQAQWSHELGTITAGIDQTAGVRGYRADYSTGIAWQGQTAFWTRPLAGNFLVVDTQGVPDVAVLADEHVVGRTDSHGILMVPNLRPYEVNRLRIDDADVSLAYQLDTVAQTVRLGQRGGSRVTFPVKRDRSLTLTLRLAGGGVVPVGASVVLPDGSQGLPVGYGGKAYIEDAGTLRTLTVRWPQHQCRVTLPPPADAAAVLDTICKE